VKKVYLDSSAFFKLFFGESGGQHMEQVLDLAKRGRLQLVISDWVINEIVWAAVKKHRDDKISKQDVTIILSQIADVVERGLSEEYLLSHSIHEKVVVTSRVIITELGCHPADALHVLIATTSQCDFFLTADTDLILAIRYGKLSPVPLYANDSIVMQSFIKSIM
jgi:predicted nucleic acid-binding protein